MTKVKVSKLTDTQIKTFINKGGRASAKPDFFKVINKASQKAKPIVDKKS